MINRDRRQPCIGGKISTVSVRPRPHPCSGGVVFSYDRRLAMSMDMKDITRCVICGKDLEAERQHVDTCGERHYKTLLKRQRGKPS